MSNLQQQFLRRRELLLKENECGLDIEEKIELHELDEDIKIGKFLVLFRAGPQGYD